MKTLIRELVPPAIWKGAKKFLLKSGIARPNRYEYGVEQPSHYYDKTFEDVQHWKKHYTQSHYYPLWTVIADRLRSARIERVLDIGCGPGQVACLIRDLGLTYTGIDFSEARIEYARKVCPELEFICADVFENDVLEIRDYDCVVTMEFLEHVDKDLETIDRIRTSSLVLATVPNFASSGHVRYFKTMQEVDDRYRSHFAELDVVSIAANDRGKTYFLLQGTR